MNGFFDKIKKGFDKWKNSYSEITLPAKDQTLISPEVPQGWTPPKPQLAQNLQPTIARAQPTSQPVIQQVPEPSPTVTRNVIGRNSNAKNFTVTPTVEQSMSKAADYYKLNHPELMGDIALQESSYDPNKVAAEGIYDGKHRDANGNIIPLSTSKGLYMYNDPTWDTINVYKNNKDSTLNLPSDDRMNPDTSSMATAYLITKGQLGRWAASANVWAPNYTWEELQPYLTQTGEKERNIIKYYAKK